MMTSTRWMRIACVAAALAAAPGGTAAAQQAAAGSYPRHTAADARFMQGMIGHHAQALEMTSLVPERSSRNDVRLLAERIDVSQRDEIARMGQWLQARGEAVPAVGASHAHHAAGHAQHASADSAARMPGMATPEELARLAASTGAEFDRLFLELMIRHHEGALQMVAELFGTPGAGQETEIYQFASEVDADQRMEIDRMRRMLAGAPSGAPRR